MTLIDRLIREGGRCDIDIAGQVELDRARFRLHLNEAEVTIDLEPGGARAARLPVHRMGQKRPVQVYLRPWTWSPRSASWRYPAAWTTSSAAWRSSSGRSPRPRRT